MLHYTSTLIAVADDRRAKTAIVPEARAGKPTVATLQYAMLSEHPYEFTQEDVLFEVWWQRTSPKAANKRNARKEFFARDQACLRTSPLAKTYGWGLHFDERGCVALLAVESQAYRDALAAEGVTVVKAMRSARPK